MLSDKAATTTRTTSSSLALSVVGEHGAQQLIQTQVSAYNFDSSISADTTKIQPTAQKIVRVRSGCWTCKARRRKCDEAKPFCMNCVKNNRECEGYDIRLSFDVDDSRYGGSDIQFDLKGRPVVGFRRRPRLKESLAARSCSSSEPSVPLSTTPTAQKELKFVTHENYNGSKRLRKKRFVSDEIIKPKPSGSDAVPTKILPVVHIENSDSEFFGFTSQHIVKEERDEKLLSTLDNAFTLKKMLEDDKDDESLPKGLAEHNVHPLPSPAPDLRMFWSVHPDEQMLLQYFFADLMPLLDNLANSPLAGLAITYCTHDMALSSFLCLSSLHLAKIKKSESLYAAGLEYHLKTLSYLGDALNAVSVAKSISYNEKMSLDESVQSTQFHFSESSNQNYVDGIKTQLKVGRSTSIAVLTVIYILLKYEVLDNAKSSTLRSHLTAYASILENRELAADILATANGMFLFRIFAWYDILTAACSKDARAPHLSGPYFFPLTSDDQGMEMIMGCPDEIILAISDICQLKHDIKYNPEKVSFSYIQNRAYEIENRIRSYSNLKKWDGRESFDYVQHIIGTQCWAQAATINLLRSTGMDPSCRKIMKSVEEFRKLYALLSPGSGPDRHMVWPVFVVGVELRNSDQRAELGHRIDINYRKTCCGSWKQVKSILQQVWTVGKSWEEVLSGSDWDNLDFLAL
ncbi:fungal-specific transcription factor domain-containing protein [Lipomyces japonicus]|uniref:fungal-specific transcription factor domain-containing protein n=1 Tax=Lipomyces japonicus TaxID=56871 RepID=UPI0034CD7A5A